MATAATVTDVEDLLGRLPDGSEDRVERLLVRAEGIVAAELVGFTFGEVDDDEATLTSDGDDILTLPHYPVRAVTAVTVNGVALNAAEYDVNTLGQMRRVGPAYSNPHDDGGTYGRWPDRGAVIVVTYDVGYASAATPPELRAVVAELAAARITNPSQVAQESLGDRSISYGSAGGASDQLSADQRRRLRHWRRNRVASARVRSS